MFVADAAASFALGGGGFLAAGGVAVSVVGGVAVAAAVDGASGLPNFESGAGAAVAVAVFVASAAGVDAAGFDCFACRLASDEMTGASVRLFGGAAAEAVAVGLVRDTTLALPDRDATLRDESLLFRLLRLFVLCGDAGSDPLPPGRGDSGGGGGASK